jgi:hypothetical protein
LLPAITAHDRAVTPSATPISPHKSAQSSTIPSSE